MLAARDQARDVCHVDHQQRAAAVRDVGEDLKIDRPGIGRRACHKELRMVAAHQILDLIVVDAAGLGVYTVADGVVELAGLVHGGTVGEVAAAGEIHAHQRIPGLQKGGIGRQIGLRPGVRLHIGVLRPEKLPRPVDGQTLYFVHILTAAIIPPAGIALGVFIGQAATYGGHHRRRGDVLRGDKLDIFLLAAVLPLQPGAHLPVLVSQIVHAFLQKIFQAVFSIFQMFC